MKCPKCQYLTFDQGDRCRNCGYDFALSIDAAELDLPIRTGDEPIGPLADFSLDEVMPLEAGPTPEEIAERQRRSSRRDTSELPLFHGRSADAPLVSLPATPRAPVSVRKSTDARPAPRPQRTEAPTFDLNDEPDDIDAVAHEEAARIATPAARVPASARVSESQVRIPAPVGARLLGGAIDLALMAGIDAAILYFTLLVCDLTFSEVHRIPAAPFAAFLVLLNGGYMASFTAAGGQSFGKMATGIRVISSEAHAWGDRVTLGQSALRAVMYLLSLLPAGLGFVPALIGPDHRAVHDRLAHTRVVKA